LRVFFFVKCNFIIKTEG